MKIEKSDIPGLIGANISGALGATGISAGALKLANAAITTTSYIAECEITGESINTLKLISSVGMEACLGELAGGGGFDGKNLISAYKTTNSHLAGDKSIRRIAKYTAKKLYIRKMV